MNIALTGFMGAGKSTTGRRLAKLLKLPFIDVDGEIERERGPIAEIFAHEGEAQFRRFEASVIDRVCRKGPAVIAVGGGAVTSAQNRRLIRKTGYIVHLQISPELAYQRVAHRRHRPLLGAEPDLATIRAMLARRRRAYADNDFAVATGGRQPAEVARIIAHWYRGKLRGTANTADDE